MLKLTSCLFGLALCCAATVSAMFSDVATETCNTPVTVLDHHNTTQRFWCNNEPVPTPSNETRRLAEGGLPIPDISGIISSGINAYNMIQRYMNPDSQNCEVVTSLLPGTQACNWYWSAATNQYVCELKWQTKMKFKFVSNTNAVSDFWVNSALADNPTDSFYQARTRTGNLGTGEGIKSVEFSFLASSCLKYVSFACGRSISAANEANFLIGVNWVYEKFWREGKVNMARCGPFNQGQNFPGVDYVLGLRLSGAVFACGDDKECILRNVETYGFPSNQWN